MSALDTGLALARRMVAPAFVGVTALLLFGACRSSAPVAVPPFEPTTVVAAADNGGQAYEQRQRQAAQAARREGRLADARWHWDVVAALRPDDADARRERKDIDGAMQAQAAERYAKARAAHQQGDVDSAQRLYLETLRAMPTHAGAADELRALERERTRRGHVQSVHAMRTTEARTPKGAVNTSATPDARIEAEHASLLARDDAVMPKSAAAPSSDTDACRRAPRLEATDRGAAVRAWRECLKAHPDDARASSRLKALEAGPR